MVAMAARMGGVGSAASGKRNRGRATTIEGASRRNGATDHPPGHTRISGACMTGGSARHSDAGYRRARGIILHFLVTNSEI
jgi:hypothetical protein